MLSFVDILLATTTGVLGALACLAVVERSWRWLIVACLGAAVCGAALLWRHPVNRSTLDAIPMRFVMAGLLAWACIAGGVVLGTGLWRRRGAWRWAALLAVVASLGGALGVRYVFVGRKCGMSAVLPLSVRMQQYASLDDYRNDWRCRHPAQLGRSTRQRVAKHLVALARADADQRVAALRMAMAFDANVLSALGENDALAPAAVRAVTAQRVAPHDVAAWLALDGSPESAGRLYLASGGAETPAREQLRSLLTSSTTDPATIADVTRILGPDLLVVSPDAITLSDHPDVAVRSAVRTALAGRIVERDDLARRAMVWIEDAPPPELERVLLRQLIRAAPTGLAQLLRRMAAHPDPGVRRLVIRGIEQTPELRTTTAVWTALVADPDAEVAEAAKRAICRLDLIEAGLDQAWVAGITLSSVDLDEPAAPEQR